MSEQQVQGDRTAEQLLLEENERLRASLAELRTRLKEPEEILRAIRCGEVDAFVITEACGERVYSLKSADLLYRVMIEDMKEGAVALDGSGVVVYCNWHFAALMKAGREAVIGTSLDPFVPAESRPALEALLRQAPGGDSRGELALRAGDGQLVPVYIAASVLSLEDHEVFCLVITDLTDQKRQEELVAQDRRKDEFMALLGHELRHPLAPARHAVDVLNLLGPVDPRVEWARGVIDRQVRHMTRLVDDLLDMAHIRQGTIRLRKEPVEVAAAVAQAVEASRPLIDARRQRLTVSVPPEPVRLEADPARLAQVLVNLLHNASKYTAKEGHIGLTARREGDGVVLRVKDSGEGIALEMLSRVFDPFTQGEGSRGGLGLGLAVVRRLVEMHGGGVTAHSDGPGRGSEFVVRLPALAGPPQVPRGPEAGPDGQPAPRRVLVVDDNEEVAESLVMLLEMGGHELRTAPDGPAALEAVGPFRPDVVLVDIGLPGMDGYEVARRLRQQPGVDGVLLVALTGYGQEEDRRRSREAGFDHHLVKPVSLKVLQEVFVGRDPLPPGLAGSR